MSFWDHLEELRWTLFRSILALFVFAIAGFSVMPWLFDNVVMAPCSSDFIVYREMCKISSHFSFLPDFCNDTFHVNIVNIKLASQFFTHMTSSFWLALLLTFPYLIRFLELDKKFRLSLYVEGRTKQSFSRHLQGEQPYFVLITSLSLIHI